MSFIYFIFLFLEILTADHKALRVALISYNKNRSHSKRSLLTAVYGRATSLTGNITDNNQRKIHWENNEVNSHFGELQPCHGAGRVELLYPRSSYSILGRVGPPPSASPASLPPGTSSFETCRWSSSECTLSFKLWQLLLTFFMNCFRFMIIGVGRIFAYGLEKQQTFWVTSIIQISMFGT